MTTTLSWQSLLGGPNTTSILRAAMTNVAHGLSNMLGEPISCAAPEVRRLDYAQLLAPEQAPRPDVGITLQLEGGLRGSALVRCPLALADQLVKGDTAATVLGAVQMGALAELGNLVLAYFLNAVVELTGATEQLVPTPPKVHVDVLAARLRTVMAPLATSDQIVIVEGLFQNRAGSTRICLWILPEIDVPVS